MKVLKELESVLCRQSRDMSEDKLIAFLYGVIVGWDNPSYNELKERHNWSELNIELQKKWHKEYKSLHESAPTLQEENKKLREAAKELIHLHMCEMEGIESGQPTAVQWLEAVDKLSEALTETKEI